MRKRLKRKRRSCDLCKPHKTGHGNRWKPAQRDRLAEFEPTRRQVTAVGAPCPASLTA